MRRRTRKPEVRSSFREVHLLTGGTTRAQWMTSAQGRRNCWVVPETPTGREVGGCLKVHEGDDGEWREIQTW